MLTAALRDLHRCYPGRFLTDVRTSCPDLWLNNPYLTSLKEDDPEVDVIECEYPLIHESHSRPVHFIQGFVSDLNQKLGLDIHLTEFRGDIHLSQEECLAPDPMAGIVDEEPLPYWLVVAGGKFDYTAKWWQAGRYQAVVDRFNSKLLFVQVGENSHFHPRLSGVIDMRGSTSLRDLILWVYHAEGVLCPVTFLMHLAAAVPRPGDKQGWRPCVVVAGGRESPHWEAYPGHQFIHTVGSLSCCSGGGCWKARVVPLGDGDEKDQSENLCVDVVQGLPHCMHMIRPGHVVDRMEYYLQTQSTRYLSMGAQEKVRPYLVKDLATLLGW